MGKALYLGAGAKIIGNKPIGDRVSIGVDTVLYDTFVESDKIVITDNTGNISILDRKKKQCKAQIHFRDDLNSL